MLLVALAGSEEGVQFDVNKFFRLLVYYIPLRGSVAKCMADGGIRRGFLSE